MTKPELIAAIIKEFETIFHSTSQKMINILYLMCQDLYHMSKPQLEDRLDWAKHHLTNEDHVDNGLAFRFKQ